MIGQEQYLQDSRIGHQEEYKPDLPIDEIMADPNFNCRGMDITPATVVDLAEDIRKTGLNTPIIVRPFTTPANKKIKYLVIAGHRRHTACKFIGNTTIKALIRYDLTDEGAYVLNLQENLKRLQLNIDQEAAAVARLMGFGYNDKEIRKILDVTYPWLKVRKELLTLPSEVRQEAADGNLSQAHITELAQLAETKQPEDIIRAAARIRDKKLKVDKTVDKIKTQEDLLAEESKTVEKDGGNKYRSHSEIDKMQDLLIAVFKGKNIAARALAWARYQITDLDLLTDVQEEAGFMGINFVIPSEYRDV